jgi:hypothetical protein
MSTQDEITQWLAKNGRSTLDAEAARQLAAESQEGWYVASHGANGYIIGKMTMQKFSSRHVLVNETGRPVLFATVESALAYLRIDLKVSSPHVFNF